MNRDIKILTGSICFLLISIVTRAQQSGTLLIEASNFGHNKGLATVNLFREQDDIPGKPFMQLKGVIVAGNAAIKFSDIPYGKYAAILFHDENSNGILDHKFGFPNEPMGFSNGWKFSLFSGMPNFSKLKFEFSSNNQIYNLKIN